MLLKGFGFSGYRSFGSEVAKIAPLRKVNLIIGKNNIGKSNIINYLNEQYSYFIKKARNARVFGEQPISPFKELDRHRSERQTMHTISFPILKDELGAHIDEKLPNGSMTHKSLANKLLSSKPFSDENGNIWFTYSSSNHNTELKLDYSTDELHPLLQPREWQQLWSALTRKEQGNITQHWIPQTIQALAYIPLLTPKIEVIPAIRKIGLAGTKPTDFSGEGIIERLAKIQNPPLIELDQKEKFSAINKFVQEVLENNSAKIEIPYDRDMILIHMDNKTLPLESLGTGVHEVIILAAAATLLEETIVCVEEPELHLHPLLQKKLVKYLSESTNNQYFFTTHSAHLLDAVESEVFHVTQENGESLVRAIASTKERSSICNDLGYKASDILQANCIIWVEGPSDRIYLNHWISAKNPLLIEGVHYSIMFYGGRLFSHITALDDDELEGRVNDFVSIRSLNRNSIIIFDSDKSHSRAKISSTKQRLKDEFNSGPGFAWVTKGREIENYLNYDKIEESILNVHPSASGLVSKGEWVNLLRYRKGREVKEREANKVKVAKHYIENYKIDFSVLDLDDRMNELCEFISMVNSK